VHLHVIQTAPLPRALEDYCRETRQVCEEMRQSWKELCGRMKLLETRFEDVDVVLSSIVRELTRLQLQSEVLHEVLSATATVDERQPEPARDYRQAG
jgi:hypothetical protein